MSAAASQATPEKTRILIVEDEGIIATDIQRTLEDLGYEVVGWAVSGPEALELASAGGIDLVLMDIRIRGDMDGIETAEQIKQRYRLPVVYLTAHTDGSILQRAKLTEPFGYLTKPFTTGDIRISIEMALQRHSRQLEVEDRPLASREP